MCNVRNLVVLLALIFVGCATIITGTKQDVSIDSRPPQAKVLIKTSGGIPIFSGTTPATCKLNKNKEYIVIISMEGFREERILLDQKFQPWVIGNLFFTYGFLFGALVDALSGAMWKLEPESIYVELIAAYRDGEPIYLCTLKTLDENGRMRVLKVPISPDRSPPVND